MAVDDGKDAARYGIKVQCACVKPNYQDEGGQECEVEKAYQYFEEYETKELIFLRGGNDREYVVEVIFHHLTNARQKQ